MAEATDPARLAEALEMVRSGRTPQAVADLTGVSRSTIYRAMRKPVVAEGRAQARAAQKSRVEALKGARRAVASKPAEVEPDDEETLAPGAPDDIALLDRLIENLETKLDDAPPERVSPIATALGNLIAKRAKMRPPAPPTAEELEAQARPAALAVVNKIETAVRAREAEAAKKGVCIHCKRPLAA